MSAGRRALHWFRIVARHGEPRGVVAPDDFELVFEGVGEPAGVRAPALAYCADWRAERLLYTLLPDRTVFAAPFLFSAQLAAAEGVVSVPFERLMEMPCAAGGTLIFSPGRAGSTLLARLLRTAGAAAVSEPDWPTQLCALDEDRRASVGAALLGALVRAGMGSLAAGLGSPPLVKLRSQCNAAPELLTGALPEARAVVLLRRRVDWAVSRHRAFAEPPDVVAETLRQALRAVDRLRAAGVPPTLIWFEALVADPACVLAALGVAAAPDAVASVMAEDAQAGTGVEQAIVRGRPVEDGFLAAFEAEWEERRPKGRFGARVADVLAQLEGG